MRAADPELVIIAGDECSRGLVVDALPAGLGAEVVVLDRAGRPVDGGDDALAADVEATLREHVVARYSRCCGSYRNASGRAGLPRLGAEVDFAGTGGLAGEAVAALLRWDQAPPPKARNEARRPRVG